MSRRADQRDLRPLLLSQPLLHEAALANALQNSLSITGTPARQVCYLTHNSQLLIFAPVTPRPLLRDSLKLSFCARLTFSRAMLHYVCGKLSWCDARLITCVGKRISGDVSRHKMTQNILHSSERTTPASGTLLLTTPLMTMKPRPPQPRCLRPPHLRSRYHHHLGKAFVLMPPPPHQVPLPHQVQRQADRQDSHLRRPQTNVRPLHLLDLAILVMR